MYATVTVANVGNRPGTEVVQCYVHALDRPPGDPVQQLRAFEKITLDPAGTTRVEFRLTERDFARYDEALAAFITTPGSYEVRIGRSSRDLPLRTTIDLR